MLVHHPFIDGFSIINHLGVPPIYEPPHMDDSYPGSMSIRTYLEPQEYRNKHPADLVRNGCDCEIRNIDHDRSQLMTIEIGLNISIY